MVQISQLEGAQRDMDVRFQDAMQHVTAAREAALHADENNRGQIESLQAEVTPHGRLPFQLLPQALVLALMWVAVAAVGRGGS